MSKSSASGTSVASDARASNEMEVVHTFAKNAFDEIWAYFQPYRGHEVVHIRTLTLGDNDELHFTKKGISVSVKQLPKLLEAVEALVAAAEGRSS